MGRLDDVDLSQKLSRKEQDKRLEAAQDRLEALRLQLAGLIGDGRLGPPVLMLFEGWDASGKGGAIKRLVANLDHRHVRVAAFAAPTKDEKRHHFLWRFFPKLPGWGGVAVFDRSWYGRVLVERVEGYASEDEWRRGYEEITGLERSLAAEGTILMKFWMHISDEEQLRRFERRKRKPLKRWKLTEEDWRNREKRPAYEEAVEEMFERTDHPGGPWTIVPGDSKRFARVFVAETVVAEIERGMRERGFEPLSEKELDAA
ncbi:MAG: AMP-polyphosphate phosphotransferase [Thermoleophilaceae bacterium]|jgi:polyphosphate kinase 2 (PPK2 family)|nr:AMP-polyphosphate phosphotransferase [Thermoleophilaceae bacterium]